MDTPKNRTTAVEGRYVREAKDDSAELTIKVVGLNRIHVSGIAFWGTAQAQGPNLGQLDFEAPLESGEQVSFTDSTRAPGVYRISLKFEEEGLIADETPAPGYFGLNVSFAGQFRRV